MNRGGSRRHRIVAGIAGLALVLGAGWVLSRSGAPESEEKESAPDGETVREAPPGNQPPPTAAAPENLLSVEELEALVASNRLHEARKQAFVRLESLPEGSARLGTELFLGDLHTRMVFEKIPMEEKITHVVGRGDTLGKLARTYGTTPELIALSNGIERNMIRLGETLRILQGSFSAVVHKTRNDMVVTLNGRFFKRYPVGTGTHSSTPEGDYVITLRLRHPVWYRPDGEQFPYGHPENLLGTHYLKLNTPGIGLHGTWEPETVGSQSSAGCVRLKNEMIEELYNLLPEGTSVRIENGS